MTENSLFEIDFSNFEPFSTDQSVEFRNLTIFMGQNGTGKSCLIQELNRIKLAFEDQKILDTQFPDRDTTMRFLFAKEHEVYINSRKINEIDNRIIVNSSFDLNNFARALRNFYFIQKHPYKQWHSDMECFSEDMEKIGLMWKGNVKHGFGSHQILPIFNSLFYLEKNKILFIDDFDNCLDCYTQKTMIQAIVEAVNRGVNVVVELHNPFMLLIVQTLVAEEKLDCQKVILHWFDRDENNVVKITPGFLDENGAYGDWPEDFSNFNLKLQNRFLDAIDARCQKGKI